MTEEPHTHRHHHITTLTVALLALLLACAMPFVLQERTRGEMREQQRSLASEQEKLAKNIEAMRSTVDSLANKATPDAESIAELKRVVAETSTMVEVVSTRMDELEKKLAAQQAQAAAIPVVVAPPAPAAAVAPVAIQTDAAIPLTRAVLSGAGFSSELAAWENAQSPARKAPAALALFAKSGLPSEASLMDELRSSLDGINKPAAVDDKTLAGKINTHLAGLVSIKKTSAQDPYAAIRVALNRGELVSLLRAVEALDEPSRAPLTAWLETAKNRTEALAALEALTAKGAN